jgi:glycosyltransferase involved in cell wall biosynthesis
VIVPAFNAAHYLEVSLPPLIALRNSGQIAEVIVADDCSTDPASVASAERHGAAVLRMAKNGGPGAARNFAAKHAVGDILWFVDADVVAHEDGARILKDAFADDRVAAVFGSYDSNPPARNFASQYKNLVHRFYHQRGKEDSDTFWSGCGAVRKQTFLELGGFDGQRYGRPSIEDIEFGFRLRAAGWSIRLAHALLGTHLKRWTLWEVIRTDIFQRAVPWSNLILSGRGLNNDLNVSPIERLRAIAAALWAVALGACAIPSLWPGALVVAAASTGIVGALNSELFAFFRTNRGAPFAVAATAFHQVYYLYSAATFAICALRHNLRSRKSVVVSRETEGRTAA